LHILFLIINRLFFLHYFLFFSLIRLISIFCGFIRMNFFCLNFLFLSRLFRFFNLLDYFLFGCFSFLGFLFFLLFNRFF